MNSELRGQTMDWNRQDITLLIQYFKEKKELWDTTCAGFKDRNVKNEAWKDLASKMNLDRKVVETKMRSLIGQFQRELKKMSSDNTTSRWYGFKLLLFLKNYKKQGIGNHSFNSETSTFGLVNESVLTKNTPQEVFHEGSNKTKELKEQKKEEHEPPKKMRRADIPETPIETNIFVKPSHVNHNTRDDFSIFGEYIASKLRNIRDPFTVSTVQNQINNIIYQAEVSLMAAAPSYTVPNYYVVATVAKPEPASPQNNSVDQLETDEEEDFDDILKSMQR